MGKCPDEPVATAALLCEIACELRATNQGQRKTLTELLRRNQQLRAELKQLLVSPPKAAA